MGMGFNIMIFLYKSQHFMQYLVNCFLVLDPPMGGGLAYDFSLQS